MNQVNKVTQRLSNDYQAGRTQPMGSAQLGGTYTSPTHLRPV